MTTLAILGAGQLGRMLAQAAQRMGMSVRFLDPSAETATEGLAPTVRAAYEDLDALTRFVRGADVVTCENEHVPVAALEHLQSFVPVRPGPRSFAVAQHRVAEKTFLASLGIPTAPWQPLDAREDLEAALEVVGLPAVIKRCRFGFDGRGQWPVHDLASAREASAANATESGMIEGRVAFERELSLVAARGLDGTARCYPLAENFHVEGMLRWSQAPAVVAPELQATAESIARQILEALDHVGVLTVELFEVGGRLLVNEIAPRVHNSGHWTIEGAVTSQFENHLRAILGLPLGRATPRGGAVLVNLVGHAPSAASLLAEDDVHLHLYGKAARPGRKLGHLTTIVDSPAAFEDARKRLLALASEPAERPRPAEPPPEVLAPMVDRTCLTAEGAR